MYVSKDERLGIALILGVEVYWGLTTVLMKFALLYTSSVGYIMLRFLIGAAVVWCVTGKRVWTEFSGQLILRGCILGFLQLISMELVVLAMRFTSSSSTVFFSKSSFLMVPLLYCLLNRHHPPKSLLLAVVFLSIGLAVFSNISGVWNIGNLLCLIAAFFNSCNMILVERYIKTNSPTALNAVCMGAAACFGVAIWLLDPAPVQWCPQMIWILFFTSVIGSALCFFLHMAGQARLRPITVSFLGLMSPVFSMIGASLIPDPSGVTEPITGQMIVGAVIIIVTLLTYLKKSAC